MLHIDELYVETDGPSDRQALILDAGLGVVGARSVLAWLDGEISTPRS
jgi:hypothetical protein